MPFRWPTFAKPRAVSTTGAPPDSVVRHHLSRILASSEFSGASRLQQLLSYVVEARLGHAATIKETEIAISVFNRQTSFDSSGDSIVRVAASNLRSRLRDYYAGTGLHDAVIIELPKGSYVPVFRFRSQAVAPVVRTPSRTRIAVTLGIIAVSAIAGGLWMRARNHAYQPPSVAVLPFLNLGGDSENDYLADSFVEEVTTSLAQVQSLRVAARSSAFQFRGKSLDIRAVGRQLGVDALVEGSIRASGGKLRINAQLINVADGFHIWSNVWETSSSEIYTVQADLTRSVATALNRPGQARLAEPRNLAAYDLYLKGQYFKDRVTSADLAKSIDTLRRSIDLDAAYAPAHAALADAYATTSYYQASPDPEVIAKAKTEAEVALKLDGGNANAHALLAWIRFFYDWDWAASERGLRQALVLNPNSARAHDWYAQLLTTAGRFDEAVGEAGRAAALDPLNPRALTNLTVALYCARRYDEAIHQGRQALELNSHFYKAHTMIGVSLQARGMLTEAEAELNVSLAENPDEPDAMAHLAAVSLALGKPAQAARVLASLESLPEPKPYYSLAYAASVQGQIDRAFTALDKSLAQRSSDIPYLNVDPVFDGVRADPRFRLMREKLHWNR